MSNLLVCTPCLGSICSSLASVTCSRMYTKLVLIALLTCRVLLTRARFAPAHHSDLFDEASDSTAETDQYRGRYETKWTIGELSDSNEPTVLKRDEGNQLSGPSEHHGARQPRHRPAGRSSTDRSLKQSSMEYGDQRLVIPPTGNLPAVPPHHPGVLGIPTTRPHYSKDHSSLHGGGRRTRTRSRSRSQLPDSADPNSSVHSTGPHESPIGSSSRAHKTEHDRTGKGRSSRPRQATPTKDTDRPTSMHQTATQQSGTRTRESQPSIRSPGTTLSQSDNSETPTSTSSIDTTPTGTSQPASTLTSSIPNVSDPDASPSFTSSSKHHSARPSISSSATSRPRTRHSTSESSPREHSRASSRQTSHSRHSDGPPTYTGSDILASFQPTNIPPLQGFPKYIHGKPKETNVQRGGSGECLDFRCRGTPPGQQDSSNEDDDGRDSRRASQEGNEDNESRRGSGGSK